MTRGTAFLITNEEELSTTEWNGDMYLEGYGGALLGVLERVNDAWDFDGAMIDFNAHNHNYEDFKIYRKPRPVDVTFDDDTYFRDYFSDYTYWKNVSDKPMTFNLKMNKGKDTTFELKPKDIAVFCFGKLYLVMPEVE